MSALSFPEHPETFLIPAEHAAPRARRRWYRQPALMTGIVVMGIIVFLAAAAPLITSYNPNAQNLSQTLLGPSAQHLLGTDQLGRDVWTRLLYGLRLDLSIACLAVLFPFTLGVVLGCIAGYFGGWVDNVIMRMVDVVVAFPFYVLIIALGHVLPNVISQAIIYSMSDIVQDMLAIVTLGYLGLGVPPPTADLGSMINDGQNFITTHWQLTTFPGLVVVVVGLGLSLIGDGLADLIRPGQT